MFEGLVNLVKASRPLQFALVFLAGATVAAIFYPTKQIKESVQKEYEQKISTIQQESAKTLATQQESYQTLSKQYDDYKVQTSDKISKLTNQISNLKSHTKTTMIKIVHPDGTVEEREETESDIDQSEQVTQQLQEEWQQKTDKVVQSLTTTYEQQISTLKSQWNDKEQSYQLQIAKLSESKEITINPKNFTIDVGALTNRDYYGHATYSIWGPFVLGLHTELGGNGAAAGAGLGLRF